MNRSILVVAMIDSIHTARWIEQITHQGWKVYIFPSIRGVKAHQKLENAIIIQSKLFGLAQYLFEKFNFKSGVKLISWLERHHEKKHPTNQLKNLIKTIKKLHPDIIHSMEIQAAGYLTLEAKNAFDSHFPTWIVTNWGSDIFLFGRLQTHKKKIREVLTKCDYYSCECQRDINLAHTFGFRGRTLPVFPNTGGFNLQELELLRQNKTSTRHLIMLKGYQNWAGRALVGLRALERCIDLLGGYEICIYSAPPDVVLAAELFSEKNGIPTRIIPLETSHKDMLILHAQARISIGLSISDAISTSFLEAMVMGSFPIQSCTACVNEWIEHSVSGMIVPPEDPDVIEMSIRIALTDDNLVDQAAELNWNIAKKRLDGDMIKDMTLNIYNTILNNENP
ncbi:MAG: glycosyltransferase [Thiothrix sp.]|uniref:glycosyltransferase n=1 Tax=Thiothrix sp. TaxID=1032 RepID=UPI00262B9C2E|nr:glycosyltransferase [Thiothrix sp.]MDD5394689.1 glycosyltransferase [Thiothrix sp.]